MESDLFDERRRDPRTQTFVPITMHCESTSQPTPAHLIDLSFGGAGVQMTAYNAPALGEYIDLEFETPNNDGGAESGRRRETGIIVNSAREEQGVKRVGIRFVQHPDIDCGLFDPIDLLSSHRKFTGSPTKQNRWETAKNFDKISPYAVSAN